MKLRLSLAVAMLAIAGTLTSCTVGNQNPTGDTGVAGNNPTGAPAETPTPEATETLEPVAVETPAPEAEMALPTNEDGSAIQIAPFPDGAPVPAAELEGSRTAAHMRFIASRLDAFLAANGVPEDWQMNGFDYISTIYTDAEDKAWDKDIMTPYMGKPDGSYSLRGWGEHGADPKHTDYNTGLNYVSGKGFVRD